MEAPHVPWGARYGNTCDREEGWQERSHLICSNRTTVLWLSVGALQPDGLDLICFLICEMRMKITDFLIPILQIRGVRFQEAPDLLEVTAPILCLSYCPCPTLSEVWPFPVWESWLPHPIPGAWVTLSFSLCLPPCLSSLHLLNSPRRVRPSASPSVPTYKHGDSEQAADPLWAPISSSM